MVVPLWSTALAIDATTVLPLDPRVQRKNMLWGWMLFDVAQQPYATLGLTFIFGPAGLLLYFLLRFSVARKFFVEECEHERA